MVVIIIMATATRTRHRRFTRRTRATMTHVREESADHDGTCPLRIPRRPRLHRR